MHFSQGPVVTDLHMKHTVWETPEKLELNQNLNQNETKPNQRTLLHSAQKQTKNSKTQQPTSQNFKKGTKVLNTIRMSPTYFQLKSKSDAKM